MQHNVGAVNTNLLLGCINTERFNTAHARRTHTTCNNRCVARLTTMAGKNAFGCNHALEVIRVGLPTHQYTRHALGGLGNGVVGREDNLANSSTGAGIQATCKNFYLSFGVKLRVQKLIELSRVNARDSLVARNKTLIDHLDGNLECSSCRALTHTSLKHPQLALLNSELNVAHIAVMILERNKDLLKFASSTLQAFSVLKVGDGLGITNTGNNVFALSIYQEVTIKLACTISRVTRKGNACGRGITLVAKDHNLYVNRGTKIVRDSMLLAIQDGALIHPAAKDGLDGKTKLQAWVRWEANLAINNKLRMCIRQNVLRENLLKLAYELLKIFGSKIRVVANARNYLLLRNGILKQVGVNAKYNV